MVAVRARRCLGPHNRLARPNLRCVYSRTQASPTARSCANGVRRLHDGQARRALTGALGNSYKFNVLTPHNRAPSHENVERKRCRRRCRNLFEPHSRAGVFAPRRLALPRCVWRRGAHGIPHRCDRCRARRRPRADGGRAGSATAFSLYPELARHDRVVAAAR